MKAHYVDLLSTVQSHPRCNTAYCLRTLMYGEQYCRFNFPMSECDPTYIEYEKL